MACKHNKWHAIVRSLLGLLVDLLTEFILAAFMLNKNWSTIVAVVYVFVCMSEVSCMWFRWAAQKLHFVSPIISFLYIGNIFSFLHYFRYRRNSCVHHWHFDWLLAQSCQLLIPYPCCRHIVQICVVHCKTRIRNTWTWATWNVVYFACPR